MLKIHRERSISDTLQYQRSILLCVFLGPLAPRANVINGWWISPKSWNKFSNASLSALPSLTSSAPSRNRVVHVHEIPVSSKKRRYARARIEVTPDLAKTPCPCHYPQSRVHVGIHN